MSTPWFFLSYARNDASTDDLRNFYLELVGQVRWKARLPVDTRDADVGFMDTSGIEIGKEWPEEVGQALRTCRVLVCLYSRNFFTKEYCGKEFQAFSVRVDQYVGASGHEVKRPTLIVPVLWDDPYKLPKPLPHVVSHIEYKNDSVGELYAAQGLFQLMRLRSDENLFEYRKLVNVLSDRIIEEAEPNLLAPYSDLRPFEEEKNAFSLPAPGETGVTETKQRRGGPSVARFVYVAGRNTEFGDVRQQVECYGDEAYEWRPYHPEFQEQIGLISQGIASNERLHYEKLVLKEDFIQRLREAEQKSVIVVIVVDPWSIKVERYQKRMTEFDREEFMNCGVLIPWNERDEETHNHIATLQIDVQTTFERKYFVRSTYFRGSIRSPEELLKEIWETLTKVRARLIKKAEVRSPLTGPDDQMPLLSNVRHPHTSPQHR